jgi:hypothetical protein
MKAGWTWTATQIKLAPMSVLIAFAAMLLPAQAEAGNVRNVQVSDPAI